MDNRFTTSARLGHDFERAYWQGLRSALIGVLRRRSTRLLPFSEVRSRLHVRGQYDRRLQNVPLANIVGSLGRTHDFDRAFRPRSVGTVERWNRVARAWHEAVALPPVELYKLGDIYFVSDGHHRVSVARQQGGLTIEARVIELQIDVPLAPDLQLEDLNCKEEQSDFFEWTNLKQLRPDAAIEIRTLGGYLDVIRNINRHRSQLGRAYGCEVSSEHAIMDWYDTVYLPLVLLIRCHGILAFFRRRLEAELAIDILHYHQALKEQEEREITLEKVLVAYAMRFGPARARRQLKRGALRQLRMHRVPSPASRGQKR